MRERRRVRLSIVAALLVFFSASAPAQKGTPVYGIAYHLSMPRPASHFFVVTITLSVPVGENADHVDLQMPMWQPGRYAVADFAKNVQEFEPRSGDRPLRWAKINDQTWRVQRSGNRSLTATYKVFGDDLSGTYAQLNSVHANYTGGEIFMYVSGHKQDPISLRIQPPDGWRVINGETDYPGQLEWTFPNYETLIDTSTEIGRDWTIDEFQLFGKRYRVVVHSRGNEGGRRPALIRDIEKIVRAEIAMWGEPEFDSYTFLIHFAGDDRSSDGMEHLTSTQIIVPGELSDPAMYRSTLETAAHEFFHAWNVKRLRPIELGPWDWTRPVATRGLWIAEGFTEYYGDLMLRRAGLADDRATLQEFSDAVRVIESAPGSKLMSANESSMAAPFIDGAVHRQRNNLQNSSISYYYKGELIGLVLDLMIRGKTNGRKSLDDVMRSAYAAFYLNSPNASYYLKGRGFTNEDFERAASDAVGIDLSDFFARYANTAERLPYEEALAYVGLRLFQSPSESFIYRIEEDPNAGNQAKALRAAWLNGR